LAIELPNLHLAIVPVFALRCSIISTTPINITTVTTTGHPGVYKVHCTPIIRGNHQVSVTVRQIELGSVPVVVPFNPYLDTITPIRTIEGLNKPYGVAINEDGHVIVTEWGGNCVTVIDKEGRKIKSFVNKYDEDCYKNTEFSSPSGIAVDPNNSILVADDHKIQKISTNVIFGEIVESVGCEGNKPLEFFEPCGIAISPLIVKG
jgi:tripartite motif-containing protein 2/3/tripartite motif-containing protein 71